MDENEGRFVGQADDFEFIGEGDGSEMGEEKSDLNGIKLGPDQPDSGQVDRDNEE